jgi:hypothetical protein
MRKAKKWPRFEGLIIAGILVAVWTYAAIVAAENGMVTYRQDNGETFIAYYQAEQLARTFPQTGMLHAEQVEGKTLIYTHSVNIGMQYAALLQLLGIKHFTSFLWLIPPIYIAGLFTAYITVKTITKSVLCAAMFLILMASDFGNNTAFAFNALRAWHYLGLFLSILGGYLIAASNAQSENRRGYLAIIGGAVISFGCGYDFVAIAAASTLITILMFAASGRVLMSVIACIGAFSVPFLIRQAEIMYWLGVDFWMRDVYYTFLIKVPLLAGAVTLPPMSVVEEFYRNANVLRPPAVPAVNLQSVADAAIPLLQFTVVPRFGYIGIATLVATVAAGLAIRFTKSWYSQPQAAAYGLVASVGLGTAIGLSVLAPFSLHVYWKHNFPLLAALVYLSTSIILTAAITTILQSCAGKQSSALRCTLPLLVIAVLATNLIHLKIVDRAHPEGLNFGWLLRVEELAAKIRNPEKQIKVLTKGFPHVNQFAKKYINLHEHSAEGKPTEIFMILSRGNSLQEIHEHPKYVVYAPSHSWCNYDSAEPNVSRMDLIQAAWQCLRNYHHHDEVLTGNAFIAVGQTEERLNPADALRLMFTVDSAVSPKIGHGDRFEVIIRDTQNGHLSLSNQYENARSNNGRFQFRVICNKIHRTVDVWLGPEILRQYAGQEISVQLVYKGDPDTYSSNTVDVNVDTAAPRLYTTLPVVEPTVEAVLQTFSDIPIVECAPSYAIFDLSSYGRQR